MTAFRTGHLAVAATALLVVGAGERSRAQGLPAGRGTSPTKTVEVRFTSHDGHPLFGKLTVPASGGPFPVVVYVQTAEGMTVDVKRPNGRGGTFNYFDVYRAHLPTQGVAFFSYEGRGIRMGDTPPRYETLDRDVYDTSTLENKVRDAVSAVEAVRRQPGLDAGRVLLMGASEGTLLAAEAATRAPSGVKALVVYAVMALNMRENFKYIIGEGAMLPYLRVFDTDNDGKVSRLEFEADPRRYRARALRGALFESLDRTGDGIVTVEDMRIRSKSLGDAVDSENFPVLSTWAALNAGVSVPKGWFKDHFAHAPIWTFLERLDIPVGVFHGGADVNTPIDAVRGLDSRARLAGKAKMAFHYFPDLDHGLGLGAHLAGGAPLPAGHRAIFEFIRTASQP